MTGTLKNSARTVVLFGRMVKFSHTVFALPFALAATALAAKGYGITALRVVAIIVAMVGARTAAMGFNRIVDRRIDAKNPRTASRELPAGLVSLPAAVALTVVSVLVFLGAAAYLGPLCLRLSPVALLLILGYSFTKRFTFLCHVVLGLAIGIAPAAAWIAVRGSIALPPVWMMLAVSAWIAGFDILYALSDREFDRGAGLHSIPAAFGVPWSLRLSSLLHAGTVAALALVGISAGLGLFYFAGVAVVTAVLVYEHAIVKPSDLSRLNVAFFNLNGYVAVIYLGATLCEVWFA